MRYAALIFICAAGAWAQIPDGVTTNVTRVVTVTPDEADFSVLVTASLDTTQEQVVQALQEIGAQNPVVTAVAAGANNYSYPPQSADSQLYYQVNFTTAPAAMTAMAKKLDGLRANLPAGFASVQYSSALTASQAAVNAAHDAVLPKLLADAQAKAQTLAAAAGLKLGGISGVTESVYGVYGLSFPVAVISTGAFSSSSSNSTGTQFSFSAIVKFGAQ